MKLTKFIKLFMMSKRKRINYRDPHTSDSDAYSEIKSIDDLPHNTSSWTKDICRSLNIRYENASSIDELVQQSNVDDSEEILLDGYDLHKPYDIDLKLSSSVTTIVRKARKIINNPYVKEVLIDAFVMSLLNYVGFDRDPFDMFPQYDFSASIGNDHKITSKVEFMIIKQEQYVVFIVEDKRPASVAELTDWGEPQIAGELFVSAFHNVFLGYAKYPIKVFAIRVVGTYFTFYKSEISRSYMEESLQNLPVRNSMVIKRFPAQEGFREDGSRVLTAWDFCNPDDRKEIIKTLKSFCQPEF
jgi:hypothetical protein